MGAITLYTGPSALDDSPIVVLATLGSTNAKTGPMIQTWIMRSDMTPVLASKTSADRSVCGDCPRRHSLGGDCYVLVHNAPQSAWKAWDRAGRPDGDVQRSAELCSDHAAHGVRLGAYGDPAAVPWQVWSEFLARLSMLAGFQVRHTGYTHQWRATMFAGPESYNQLTWCRRNLMASCDTPIEAALARASGWRFFAAIPVAELDKVPSRTVQCLADRTPDRHPPVTCQTCGICDGVQDRATRASVYIAEHGARSGAKVKCLAKLAVLA